MQTYFVKRGDQVIGPLSVAKIRALARDKKLRKTDRFSTTGKEPWSPASVFIKTLLNPAYPLAKNIHFGKTLTNRYFARFQCPKCNLKMRTFLNEYQSVDQCPECSINFTIPTSIKTELQRHSDEALKQKADAKSAKQAEKAEKAKLKKEAAIQKKRIAEEKEAARQAAIEQQKQLQLDNAQASSNQIGILRVSRPAGTTGSLSTYKVFINGHETAHLNANEQVDLTLAAGTHLVEVKGGMQTGTQAQIPVRPNTMEHLSIDNDQNGGMYLGVIGAAALAAGFANSEDVLDVGTGIIEAGIELLAAAGEIAEAVDAAADVADAVGGFFDLFGD